MKLKIVFPSGYRVRDIHNDNIDVNIFLSNNNVFFGTLFTVNNIYSLLNKESDIYFWSTDMLIVSDLSQKTIRKAIEKTLESGHFEEIFSEIGTIGKGNFDFITSFDDIEDMGNAH